MRKVREKTLLEKKMPLQNNVYMRRYDEHNGSVVECAN